MKTKDLITITTMALGTAALTVTSFWSGPINAAGDGPPLAVTIAKPKLIVADVELTVAAAHERAFAAGDQPEFELRAVNTADKPAALVVQATMNCTSITDTFSRVARPAAQEWEQTCPLTLAARETKSLKLQTNKKLPANALVSVYLKAVDPATKGTDGGLQGSGNLKLQASAPRRVLALSFSTVSGTARPGGLALLTKVEAQGPVTRLTGER